MMRIRTALTACILFILTDHSPAQTYLPSKDDPGMKVKPAPLMRAYAFPMTDVELLESPFRHARSIDSGYLMTLSADRLLHRFHRNAGLPAKDSVYGGWESEGLSGHTLGHYLSAASLMYATTGDTGLKYRVSYIVSELARCQQARGNGYVGAIPREDSIFAQVSRGVVRSSGFDLNGGWSPWYTVHKVMAGLLDAYLHTGNAQALQVVRGMGDWTWNTVSGLSDSLRLKMLNCEYGGMNEVLANLYAITGDAKYLRCSYLFQDEFVMGKLAQRTDPMPGKHSNTNVPKAIGAARQYELTGNGRDSTIASFFWETIVRQHTYVIGGNSNYEYCGEPGKLNDRLSDNTCETCNTHNMLKLTGHLFAWSPDAALGDYYERALYNHILASQHPGSGMMTYFVPLRMGAKKQFSDSFNTFTCCVGSGMENHSKYNEGIYYEGNDGSLYVNLFIPSVLHWKKKGDLRITQETAFPREDRIRFTVNTIKPLSFPLRIRKPGWCGSAIRAWINDIETAVATDAAGFLVFDRTWRNGDRLRIDMPMRLYTEPMPDNPRRIAFLYGPLVLAGRLGREMPDPVFGTPVIMTDRQDITDSVIRDQKDPLQFRWQGLGKPHDVSLSPFHEVYDEYYSVYWDRFTAAEWQQRRSEHESEKKRLQAIAMRTIDEFRIGEMQPERDHGLTATERSYVSDAIGRMGREARAGHHFTFTMKVIPDSANTLLLTYIGDDRDRKFDVIVDGQRLTTVEWKGGLTGRFYDETYTLPLTLTSGKRMITVKIDAAHGTTAGRIFNVKTLRDQY
jgi:DUF1680 family protein